MGQKVLPGKKEAMPSVMVDSLVLFLPMKVSIHEVSVPSLNPNLKNGHRIPSRSIRHKSEQNALLEYLLSPLKETLGRDAFSPLLGQLAPQKEG